MIWVEKQLHKGKVIYFVTTKHESEKLKLFTYDPWTNEAIDIYYWCLLSGFCVFETFCFSDLLCKKI